MQVTIRLESFSSKNSPIYINVMLGLRTDFANYISPFPADSLLCSSRKRTLRRLEGCRQMKVPSLLVYLLCSRVTQPMGLNSYRSSCFLLSILLFSPLSEPVLLQPLKGTSSSWTAPSPWWSAKDPPSSAQFPFISSLGW